MENENKSQKDSYGVDLNKSYINSCSAHDCTGLIPSLPQSKAEVEAYEDLYHFLPEAKTSE